MIKNKPLLISPILKSLSKFRKLRYKKVIQNSEFEYGIKISNGDVIFEGGIIKDIEMIPFKSNINFKRISERISMIPKLNPGDIHEIWFERISSPISGPFWLNFNLETKDEIIPFQEGIYFIIKDRHSLQQEITNILLIILTIITIGISIWRLLL